MSPPTATQPTVAQPVHRPPTPLFASFRRKRSKIGLGVPSMSSNKHTINPATLPSQQTASLHDDGNAQEKRRKTVRRIDPPEMAGGGQVVPPAPMGEGMDLNRADTLRAVSRGAPGDPQGRIMSRSKASNRQSVGRQSYYEQAFSDRSDESWKQQIQSESIVGAEVKTNVIIKDEFTFITNLSNQLAERFQRPVSSIAIIVQHGACMLFGGSFDAAYMMNITAIPSSLSPTMNRRNAAMIQAHMDEALGVPAARGLINFRPIPEDCIAVGGKTVAGILDEAAKLNGASSEPSTSGETKVERRPSRRISLTSFMTNLAHRNNGLTQPLSPQDAMSNLGEAPGPPGRRMRPLAEVDENTPGEPKSMMRLLSAHAPDHLRKNKSSEALQAAADENGTSRKRSIW